MVGISRGVTTQEFRTALRYIRSFRLSPQLRIEKAKKLDSLILLVSSCGLLSAVKMSAIERNSGKRKLSKAVTEVGGAGRPKGIRDVLFLAVLCASNFVSVGFFVTASREPETG